MKLKFIESPTLFISDFIHQIECFKSLSRRRQHRSAKKPDPIDVTRARCETNLRLLKIDQSKLITWWDRCSAATAKKRFANFRAMRILWIAMITELRFVYLARKVNDFWNVSKNAKQLYFCSLFFNDSPSPSLWRIDEVQGLFEIFYT